MRHECSTDYRTVLENKPQLRLSEILADVQNELRPSPGRYDFLNLLAELFEDQPESIFLEALEREVSFAVDRNQSRGLDLLLDIFNRSRGEEDQFRLSDQVLTITLN